MEKKCAIRMENITKRFGSKVIANKDVNLELYEGEILSLLGENGSGKTTLMNMLSGIYFPDEGQIYVHDKPVTIASPKDAFDLGIGMIHQHFKLVDLFTATENIILGLEGKLDLNNARQKVKDICDKYGFDIDPDMKIYDMSVSQKQTVEIVKVLYRGADILILDEPTSGLDPVVRDDLLDLFLEFVQDEEHAILISTHITSDLEKVADYVTFLHAGKLLLSKPKDELLWQYGILRCGEALFQKLESSEVLAWRKKDYSYDVLVPDREELLRRYPEAVVDRATMDEILLLYVKGD